MHGRLFGCPPVIDAPRQTQKRQRSHLSRNSKNSLPKPTVCKHVTCVKAWGMWVHWATVNIDILKASVFNHINV